MVAEKCTFHCLLENVLTTGNQKPILGWETMASMGELDFQKKDILERPCLATRNTYHTSCKMLDLMKTTVMDVLHEQNNTTKKLKTSFSISDIKARKEELGIIHIR
jgi:hypothetical protein